MKYSGGRYIREIRQHGMADLRQIDTWGNRQGESEAMALTVRIWHRGTKAYFRQDHGLAGKLLPTLGFLLGPDVRTDNQHG